MKQLRFSISAAITLGLLGGGSVSTETAHAQAVIWQHEYPDIISTTGATDIPVGVTASTKHVLVGGTRIYNTANQTFQVVKYDFAPASGTTGNVLHEVYWPASEDDYGVREVKAMASWTDGASEMIWVYLTGTILDSGGHKRATTLCFNTGGSDGLQFCWSRVEDNEETDLDDIPVAIAANGDGDLVAVAIQSGDDIVTRVYNRTDGSSAMPAGRWSDYGISTAATAVGIAMVTTGLTSSPGEGVIVGATAPHPTQSGNAITLFGFHVGGGTGLSSGAKLGNSPCVVAKASGDTDIAKAMAPAPLGLADRSFAAITGHRTNGSTQDWVTAVVQAVPREPNPGPLTDEIVVDWVEELDNGGNIDVPTAITIFGTTAALEFRASLRVAVTGTTRENSGATTNMLTAVYYAEDVSQQLQWFNEWNNTGTGYNSNDVPIAIAAEFVIPLDPAKPRVYVTGTTQKGSGSGANEDLAVVAYDATANPTNRLIWAVPYHLNDDNADAGLSVWLGTMYPDSPSTAEAGLFVTGRTYNSTYGHNWLTYRLEPGEVP